MLLSFLESSASHILNFIYRTIRTDGQPTKYSYDVANPIEREKNPTANG